MPATSTALNPYQSLDLDRLAAQPVWNPYANLTVEVQRRWLHRRIRLCGFIDTEIVWDARSATEYVKVDSKRVASAITFLYVPRFEFPITIGPRTFDAAIDVHIRWLVQVSAFRLTLGGNTVYAEGNLP